MTDYFVRMDVSTDPDWELDDREVREELFTLLRKSRKLDAAHIEVDAA